MNRKTFETLIQRFAHRLAVVFFMLLLVASACKDKALIGLEVQPEGALDNLQSIDTFTVVTKNIVGTPQQSDEFRNYIGRLQNDQFGVSEAVMYAALQLSGDPIEETFKYNGQNTVDSVILFLRPLSVYGNIKDVVPIEVYELEELIDYDSNYVSNQSFRIDDAPIGKQNLSFSSETVFNRKITIDGDTGQLYRVRIPLNVELGENLYKLLGQDFYTPEQFLEFFPGLAFKVSDEMNPSIQGAIYDFLFATGESYMKVYMHDVNDQKLSLKFEMTPISGRVNQFINDYSGSAAEATLNMKNPDKLYVQGMSGLKTEIVMPSLYQFGLQNDVAVSKASLIFKTDPSQPAGLEHSPKLYLLDLEIDSETGEIIESLTLDFAFSATRSGGNLEDGTYTFDLTRYVQKILEEAALGNNINLGLRLNAQVPVINGNVRFQNVLSGSDNIVFKVYYTDLKE